MDRRTLLLIALAIIALMPGDLFAQGCAMCKAVAEGDQKILGGPQPIGKGLNKGILYLMAAPYILLFLLFRKRIVAFFKEFSGAQG